MLTFHKVRYKNFLSAGNAPIEIDFTKHPTTLIVGPNGTGKSTMSEAICFALYGKPLRNINKPKLVNSINTRDCLVELWFRTSTGEYRIRRGIKPTVFEVYENDKLVPAPAAALDYQELLETQILKLNYKSFQQVVVLGNASYVPFMRLTAAARRELIEDLLDIEVFSSMNALAKEDLSHVKIEADKVNQAHKLVAQQFNMAQQFTEQLEEQRQAAIARVDRAITEETQAIQELTEESNRLATELETHRQTLEGRDEAYEQLEKYQDIRKSIETRTKKIEKERAFYEQHDHCPTCEQGITSEFKQARYEALDQKQKDAEKATAQCEKLIARYQREVDAKNSAMHEGNRVNRELGAVRAKLSVHQKRVQDLEAERTRVAQAPTQTTTVSVSDLEQQLNGLTQQQVDLSRKRVIMEAASMLLKDSGIKARVIKHYLPIINRTINAYLGAMDFPIQFVLDEEFTEHLKSRYRDEFAYESFSEGEKKRIDLALLLTWRAVARMKNSASTNLLILDEVFDSSLDAAGTEEFLKIIRGLEKDTNVFVISHKTDQLVDKFSHVLTFQKQRGFSQLKP